MPKTVTVRSCDTKDCGQTSGLAICTSCKKDCCVDHRLEGFRHSTKTATKGQLIQVFICSVCQAPLRLSV